MNISLRRPSPALVIACIALFVSMGGVSYGFATGSIDGREIKNGTIHNADIRNGTITTKDLRNNEVRGADIRNSSVRGRDVAFNTLGANDIKESTLGKVPSAEQADSAAQAGNSASLGGVPASGYVRNQAPSFTALPGAVPGELAPGYDIANGYVYLQGTTSSLSFSLPAGARPADTSRFIVPVGGDPELMTIEPTGAVTIEPGPGPNASLDGISFAAAR